MDINDYISNNKNKQKPKYVKYDNIYIKDDKINKEQKEQIEQVRELSDEDRKEYRKNCVKLCSDNNSCVGLNIDKDDTCGLIKKVSKKNKIINNKNNTAYLKEKVVRDYSKNGEEDYIVKLGDNNYISNQNMYGLETLSSTNNLENALIFNFNENEQIVEKTSSKCVQNNGIRYILSDCDNNNKNQKFIIEDNLNTMRDNNNNCLTLNKNIGIITSNKCNNKTDINNSQFVKVIRDKRKLNEEYENINSKLSITRNKLFNKTNNKIIKKENEINNIKDVNDTYDNKICKNDIYRTVINISFFLIVMLLLYYLFMYNPKSVEKIED